MRNRLLYAALIAGLIASCAVYGEPLLYMTLYALLLLVFISFLLAYITLYGIKFELHTEKEIVTKQEPNRYFLTLKNYFGLGTVRCVFFDNHFAISTETDKRFSENISLRPFMKPVQMIINFTVLYRGVYKLGLCELEARDFLGLFRLHRRFPAEIYLKPKTSAKKLFGVFSFRQPQFERKINPFPFVSITAYPRVTYLENFPAAVYLLSMTSSQFDIRRDDNSDIADMRPYLPSDTIKQVHWKLTAKRGELIVKNFQSASVNAIAIIVDTRKQALPHQETVKLEDAVLEVTIAMLRYCLDRVLPVELLAGKGLRTIGKNAGDFDSLYNAAAVLEFHDDEIPVRDVLNSYLNEASRYVNAVILTADLDAMLYEQIINAVRFGHFIAVLYFAQDGENLSESEDIFRKLQDSGIACMKK